MYGDVETHSDGESRPHSPEVVPSLDGGTGTHLAGQKRPATNLFYGLPLEGEDSDGGPGYAETSKATNKGSGARGRPIMSAGRHSGYNEHFRARSALEGREQDDLEEAITAFDREEARKEANKDGEGSKSKKGKGKGKGKDKTLPLESSSHFSGAIYRRDFSPSESIQSEDFRRPAAQLRKDIGAQTQKLLEIVAASGNMKREYKKNITDASKTIESVVDEMLSLTATDETERLRATTKRLEEELNHAKKELHALKQAYQAKCGENAHRNKPEAIVVDPPMNEPVSHPRDADMPEWVQYLEQRLTVTFGNMLNARIAGLEPRLAPAPSLRPPLASDKRQAQQQPRRTVPIASTSSAQGPNPPSFAAMAAEDLSWTKVGRDGRPVKPVGPRTKATKPVGSSPPQPAPQATKKKPKLAAPKSTAVLLTITPEQAERGSTYAETITKARQQFKLTELIGIEGAKVKVSATGARVFEIPGADSGEKADLLASKLREVLGDAAQITRPVKTADLRVSGLDDSVVAEEIREAVAAKGQCPLEQVHVGPIRVGTGGLGAAVIKCPIPAAKILAASGRITVGWVSAPVKALEPLPLRCFGCMITGHTKKLCPHSNINYTDTCFRCGANGHVSATCSAEPNCIVCKTANLPANHVMGSSKCNPPPVKAKIPNNFRAARREVASSAVQMEAEEINIST